MTKFKSKPRTQLRALPDDDAVATFTTATRNAEVTAPETKESTTTVTPRQPKTQPRRKTRPWDGLDPKAKPTSGMNVRLNDYQLSMLRFIAEAEERSIQQIIKRLLIPAVETEADRLG